MDKKFVLSWELTVLLMLPAIVLAAPNLVDIATSVVITVEVIIAIIAGGFVVVMFILAGFKYLTAQGNPQQVTEANKAVIWGLVGTGVIVLSTMAQWLVKNQLGV